MDKHTEFIFPPVVAVLGHVDHGKTTLLDTIRKTSVAKREHGGITQKIGASSVEIDHEGKKRLITFIDTPGHEAFAKMRGRGAQAADIGLLIVSCVDGVMPQTKESINLLKASGVAYIVVLTKSDDLGKNPEKAKQQLIKEKVMLEGYGGDVPVIEVSAKTGDNIKELLDLILLVNDLHPKAPEVSVNSSLSAIVIESKLDPKAGSKATIVIKNGQISLRDDITTGEVNGRVRSLLSDSGKPMHSATVGQAVEVLGFEKTPSVGNTVYKNNEKPATTETQNETETQKDVAQGRQKPIDENIISLILVADTLGSLEAIIASLPPKINLISKKTGDITTADVLLAKSIGALVLGFNIKIKPDVAKLASTEKVLVKSYSIIYEMLDEIKDVVEGKALSLLEEVYGTAKILASFPFNKQSVMGVKVLEGRVAKGDKVRIERGDQVIGEGHINSVRVGKEQTSKVETGQEAGIIVGPSIDFAIGDMVICHN
ncbi:MAG: GTP-binding protein [Candidatus Levybacteria bacterium]|nr:GTP-binding protein [Candidatus Levybacteria bacterium]